MKDNPALGICDQGAIETRDGMGRNDLDPRQNSAYTWALHCCHGNQEEAKDVLQTVYLTILEGKAEFSNLSSFKTCRLHPAAAIG